MMNTKSTYLPKQLAQKKQWLIFVGLIALMLMTRSGLVSHIHDASWAVLFLVGFYLRHYLGLPLVILTAIGIDFAVIAARGGHQDYYLTPSYLFVIPAYSVLWFAGRAAANNYSETIKGFVTFICIAVIGIVACDLLSSGGFYLMSASIQGLSIGELVSRISQFTLISLQTTLLYLACAAIVHFVCIQAYKITNHTNTQNT